MDLVKDSNGWYFLQPAKGLRLLLGRVVCRPIWTGASWGSQWETQWCLAGPCKTTTWATEEIAIDYLMRSSVSTLRDADRAICNSDWTKIREVE